mmetsp:Transcript_64660/g.187381  ORF Transcript_64660/g.187381 Transcript_64660/m.187381 type:complete len:204 (-) Transcript_64660:55-666(-)
MGQSRSSPCGRSRPSIMGTRSARRASPRNAGKRTGSSGTASQSSASTGWTPTTSSSRVAMRVTSARRPGTHTGHLALPPRSPSIRSNPLTATCTASTRRRTTLMPCLQQVSMSAQSLPMSGMLKLRCCARCKSALWQRKCGSKLVRHRAPKVRRVSALKAAIAESCRGAPRVINLFGARVIIRCAARAAHFDGLRAVVHHPCR